jgi:hypothetical protein
MIPLYYFLFAWVLFLGIFLIMTLLALFQMIRFAIPSIGTIASLFFFVFSTSVVIFGCVVYFLGIDWTQSINLFAGITLTPIMPTL